MSIREHLDKMRHHFAQVQASAREVERLGGEVSVATYTENGKPLFLIQGGKPDQIEAEKKPKETK